MTAPDPSTAPQIDTADIAALRATRAKMTPGRWRYCGASDSPCSCGLVWSVDADRVVACVKVRAEWAGDDGVNNLGDGPGIAALVNAADALLGAAEERDELRSDLAAARAEADALRGLLGEACDVAEGNAEGWRFVASQRERAHDDIRRIYDIRARAEKEGGR